MIHHVNKQLLCSLIKINDNTTPAECLLWITHIQNRMKLYELVNGGEMPKSSTTSDRNPVETKGLPPPQHSQGFLMEQKSNAKA